MKSVTVSFNKEYLKGNYSVPASKSISNRLLIIRFLSKDAITIGNLSDAMDTVRLDSLLAKIRVHSVHPAQNPLTVDAGDSGTVMRFLAALLAITPGEYLLTGSDRMKQRPIGPLVEALIWLGAGIEYAGKTGFPPLKIQSKKASGGGVEIDSETSSQFISALLLIAPALTNGLTLYLKGIPVSLPYIRMTTSLLSRCGINVISKENAFVIKPQSFAAGHFAVEADWSAAAFWYEMAVIAPRADLFIPGLDMGSIQGDRAAAELFHLLGIQTLAEPDGIRIRKFTITHDPIKCTMTDLPDLVLPFAVACSISSRKASIHGIHHLEWKESKRLTALCSELEKIGVKALLPEEGILHLPGAIPASHPNGPFLSWNDHRMVMALAPLAIYYGSIQISDPEVVTKSYPAYWDELRRAGFSFYE